MEFAKNANGDTILIKIIFVKRLVICAMNGTKTMEIVLPAIKGMISERENVLNKTLSVQ